MIAEWPRTSPYEEAAARLRDAIAIAAIQDAAERLAAPMRTGATVNTAPDYVSNTHSSNIRDDIDALDESNRP